MISIIDINPVNISILSILMLLFLLLLSSPSASSSWREIAIETKTQLEKCPNKDKYRANRQGWGKHTRKHSRRKESPDKGTSPNARKRKKKNGKEEEEKKRGDDVTPTSGGRTMTQHVAEVRGQRSRDSKQTRLRSRHERPLKSHATLNARSWRRLDETCYGVTFDLCTSGHHSV